MNGENMNLQNKLLLSCLLLIVLLMSGCLYDGFDAEKNAETEAIINIDFFRSGAPDNVPTGSDLIQYTYNSLPQDPHYNSIQALFKSDYLITGKVVEILPSQWSTHDGKIPETVSNRLIFTDADGTVQTIREISGDDYIYTLVKIKKLDNSPGDVSDEFYIKIYGGQVDNIVMADSVGFPNAWDMEVGKMYQLMVKSTEIENEYSLIPSSLGNAHYRKTTPGLVPDFLNPENSVVNRYASSDMNVPIGDNIVYYHDSSVSEPIVYSDEELMEEADLAFYGTVKQINPSVWSTSDGKAPQNPVTYQNLTEAEETPVGENYIYTTFIFEVDTPIKGNFSGDVTVYVKGGQVENYVQYDSMYYPAIFDIQEGDQYLVYMKNGGILYNGLFILKRD